MKNNRSKILNLHELYKDENAFIKSRTELKDQINEIKNDYHSILGIVPIINQQYDENNLLINIPYSLKDNISTKNIRTTGGSLLLSNYEPLFDSYVAQLLKESGATLVAKDALDEFGLGGTGTWCAYGKVLNPYDANLIPGGSSSGSNVNVCTNLTAFSIGTDTGDSIRHPASFLNNVGYKPTYGLISRYGVFPYSPSLDTVGVIASYVTDIAIVLDTLVKKDPRDFSNVKSLQENYFKNLNAKDLSSIKLLYLKNCEQYMYQDAKEEWKKYLAYLKRYVNINEIDFDEKLIDCLLPTYNAISFAEATTSLANLTGMTFGNKVVGKNYYDSITLTRTKYLGEQIKKRFLLGSYVLTSEHYDEIFNKAKKIRRIIKDKVEELLKEYDAIIIPGASSFALSYEELIGTGMNKCDDLLLLANFSGNPSITIPAIKLNPKFLGINLLGKAFCDQELLNIALSIENINEQYK